MKVLTKNKVFFFLLSKLYTAYHEDALKIASGVNWIHATSSGTRALHASGVVPGSSLDCHVDRMYIQCTTVAVFDRGGADSCHLLILAICLVKTVSNTSSYFLLSLFRCLIPFFLVFIPFFKIDFLT